jgi:hypothetical protein
MFKRAMRVVMMIGLVALLGAKAEAHYVYVSGNYKYCSICVDAKLKGEEDSINPTTHTEELEFLLTTELVEILCPDGRIVFSSDLFQFVVKKTIGKDDITIQVNGQNGPLTTAEVKACVSDTALLLNSVFCGVKPKAVLIRQMRAEITTSACYILCDTVDTFVTDCILPAKYNLNNPP